MWTRFKALAPFGKGLLGVAVGGVLWLLALHAYTDHKALHEIVVFLNANAGKIAALPTPGK